VSAGSAIMSAVLDASIPRNIRRRLRHAQALAVVVHVPGPDWIEPAHRAFRTAFGSRWVVMSRAPSNWPFGTPDLSAKAAVDLSEGRCVAAICVGETDIPQALRVTADLIIRITPPNAEVVRRAIARFAGGPIEVEEGAGVGLSFHHLIACFRPGTGAQGIADRVAIASRMLTAQPDERLPDLADAVEYGVLREWGLELGEAIELYRRKALSWADMPHGICVAGPPGTGKSVYARALARHCKCPILFSSVPEWFLAGKTGYLDDCIRAVRQTFDSAAAAARAHGVAILMLDEVDAIPRRNSNSRNADFWSAILAEVLLRLDNGSSSGRTGVIVVSATNVPSRLDPALLRPGRLERLVTLEPANAAGILSMLKFHVNGDVAEDDLVDVAHLIERSTAAEVMATVREGRSIARRAGRPLEAGDLKSAVLGKEPEATILDDRVFAHEAGHVAVALAIGYGKVRHCAVGARIGATNRTLIDAVEGSLATRRHIEDRVTMMLGGRAAELALYGDRSVGSGGDEQSDVGLATAAISAARLSFCVADTIVFHGSPREAAEAVRYDPKLRELVENDLQRLQKKADAIVDEHLGAVVAIAQALRARQYLNGGQLKRIFDAAKPIRTIKKIGRTDG
jgi:cell division protease FtsH